MKKLINDLKHLVNPVNPVKNIKKRNEAKLSLLNWVTFPNSLLSSIGCLTKRTQNVGEASLLRYHFPPAQRDVLISFLQNEANFDQTYIEKRNEPKIGWHFQATACGCLLQNKPKYPHYQHKNKGYQKTKRS